MHKPESVLGNGIHENLGDRKGSPNQGQKTRPKVNELFIKWSSKGKIKESDKLEKNPGELKRLKKIKKTLITIVPRAFEAVLEPEKKNGGNGDEKKHWNYADHNTTKIGQHTEKSPVNMRRLMVYQIPEKNYQGKPLWEKLEK